MAQRRRPGGGGRSSARYGRSGGSGSSGGVRRGGGRPSPSGRRARPSQAPAPAPRQEPTREDYHAHARQMLDEGLFYDTIHAVACALSFDPGHAESLQLADDMAAGIRRRGHDPLKYAPIDDPRGVYFATAALHARMLAQRGETLEAANVLFGVVAADPTVLFANWGAAWLAAPGVAAQFDSDRMVPWLGELMSRFPGTPTGNPEARRVIGAALPLICQVLDAQPDAAALRAWYSIMLRKVGRHADAISEAQRAYRDLPGYIPAISAATALKEIGETDQAVEWFKRSIPHDSPPANASRLEIGDALLEVGRHDEAAEWYQQVLRSERDHPWAHPSLLACRALNGDEAALPTLERLARRGNDRALAMIDLLANSGEPYLEVIPRPSEALLNLLESLVAQGLLRQQGDADMPTGCTALESPSMHLAWKLEADAAGVRARPLVSVAQLQQPDPRLPRGNTDFVLWKYSDCMPSPAVPPPRRDVVDAVAPLAATRFDREEWAAEAREIAASIRPGDVQGLAWLMVHPPPRPRDMAHEPAWRWVLQLQVAAAFVIAALPDAGWNAGSQRRRMLLSLALGPMDWTVTAALMALAWLAGHDPAVRQEYTSLLIELYGKLPAGFDSNRHPIVCLLLGLPDLPAETRANLERERAALENL